MRKWQEAYIPQKMARSIYPTKTITDSALLTNTLHQAEFLLDSLEQAARGISLFVNTHKTRVLNKKNYMCFKQKRAISTRSEKPQFI